MNLSALFIKRPVTTTLVMLGIMVFGTMAYQRLPVSDLPTVDYPTIQVSASLPGASPETMASTVALPLEKQFAGIAGLANINSTSQLGGTSITLQFDLSRNIEESFRIFQGRILAEYEAMIEEMGFHVIDATKSIEAQQKQMRRIVLQEFGASSLTGVLRTEAAVARLHS